MTIEPLRIIRSRTLVLPAENIDTDQIIPARFLTTTSQAGLGRAAFHDWRWRPDGSLDPECPLNAPDVAERRILVAGANFGCGSSREHAPWALRDFGVRAILSSDIADIFRSNALKNGLAAIEIDEATHRYLLDTPGIEIEIDLERQEIGLSNGRSVAFAIEPFSRRCLLDGVDTLGALMQHLGSIRSFEARKRP